jgi:hypothetical protein
MNFERRDFVKTQDELMQSGEWSKLSIQEHCKIVCRKEGWTKEETEELIQKMEAKEERKNKSYWHCRIPAWYSGNSGGMMEFWINDDGKNITFESDDSRINDELIRETLQILLEVK